MKTFPYVEDYLEVINGDRDLVSGKPYGLFNDTPPIVSLARYDVQILASMSSATLDGKSLTDRQAELAVKIILKYRKQLEKLGLDVSPVEIPKYRLGIRQIDRRRLLFIENDKIILKFPYETSLINDIRDLAKISQGRWNFNSVSKVWNLALTETNVVAAYGFAKNNQFEISEDFEFYHRAVLGCEAVPYEIQLTEVDGKLTIINAPAALTSAIENFCGFDISNLEVLIDNSPFYGYTVDDKLAKKVIDKRSPRVYNLMTNLETKFAPGSGKDIFEDVLNFAKVTGRFPIYVYEPDMSNKLFENFVQQYFQTDEVYRTQQLKKIEPIVYKKIIYFNKYHTSWEQPIPLLISGQGMMHGGEKSMLLQQAKKVVYFATEVYNHKKLKTS